MTWANCVHIAPWSVLLLDTRLFVQKVAGKQSQQAEQYRQLLDALNDVAHHEISEWMRHERQLSEPFVARTISQQLPAGISSKASASLQICCCEQFSMQSGLTTLTTCMISFGVALSDQGIPHTLQLDPDVLSGCSIFPVD